MADFKTIYFGKHKVPDFVEKKGKGAWVFNGVDDKYPNYLIDLFNRSSVHNALVLGKASYIYGNGFETDNITTKSFIDNANAYETLNEVAKKAMIDEELFGGYYLECIWSNDGSRLASVSHLQYAHVRVSADEKVFYHSPLFAEKKKVSPTDVNEIPAFDINNKVGKQILFIKNYRPDVRVYSLPDSVSANAAIETNIEIANYHLNNIKNGFSGGFIINFKNGKPTEEEQDRIYSDIEEQHTGSDAAGRFVLFFNDGPTDAPDIIPISQNDMDKMFEQLRKDTNEEIFIGHRIVSPALFGIKTEGQLGGTQELLTAFEIFKSTVIREKQLAFEDVFSNLAYLATGVKDELKLNAIPPVQEQIPFTEIIKVMTRSEIREKAGLPPETVDPDSTQTFSRHRKDKQKDLEDFEVFNKFGRVVKDEELINSRQIDYIDDMPVVYQFDTLTEIEKKVLGITANKPNIKVNEVAGALGVDVSQAKEILKGLSKKDLLWVNKSESIKTTSKGDSVVDNMDLPEFEIVYKYEKRPDAEGSAILPNGRTRDFCEQMIRANKVFTRDEIDKISKRVGYNVWKFRGGWMTQPDGEHTPYCRHYWNQYLVKKK